jgi:5-formyltetrahydrofolate cyclo-ligase
MVDDKQDLREAVWRALQQGRVARFPGARGRIPNFTGAEAAAERLAGTSWWKRATTLKCNPDSPQRKVRHRALLEGKRVYMAVPKLADVRPFLLLDPERLDATKLWEASSIKGAAVHGRPVSVDEMPSIDLIVTGCVAVGRDGVRLGKGGGYSDLEYAVLREAGKVGPDTPVLTTVHSLQVQDAGMVPREPQDVTMDGIITPEGVTWITDRAPRPEGVLWDRLPEDKLAAIPVLGRLRQSST